MIETADGRVSSDQPAEGADSAPPPGPDSPAPAQSETVAAPDPNNPLEEAQADAARERAPDQGYQ